MHRNVSALLLLLCILPALPSPLSAGGWTQKEGETYIKITYGSSSANTIYRFDGEEKFPTDNPPWTIRNYPLADRALFFYMEYGVTDDLTLIGSGMLKRTIVTTPVERKTTEGLGDFGLAARYRLAQFDNQVVSATLGLTVPPGYSRDFTPPLGPGNVSIELAGNYGISLYPLPAYATGSIGYRHRSSLFTSSLEDESQEFKPDYADEIFSELEVGYTVFERVLLHGVTRFLFSTRTDEDDFDVEHPPETQQYIKIGGGTIVKVYDGFSVSADAFVTPYGKKASNSFDLYLGISYEGALIP